MEEKKIWHYCRSAKVAFVEGQLPSDILMCDEGRILLVEAGLFPAFRAGVTVPSSKTTLRSDRQ